MQDTSTPAAAPIVGTGRPTMRENSTGIRALLKSKRTLRQSILVSEIILKPLALRE